jgi:hypothetical protein
MRFMSVIAVLSFVTLAQASATEPEPQSATVPQPAQDSSPAQVPASPPDLQTGAKSPVAGEKSPAASPAAAPTSAVAKTDKPELSDSGKNLLHQGYKLEVRDGVNYFCKKEPVLGTRLRENKVCGTEESVLHRNERDQSTVRDSLKNTVMGHSDGH